MLTAGRGHRVHFRVTVVLSRKSDRLTIGEKRGNISYPTYDVNRCASPPVAGTLYKSPAYENTISEPFVAGKRINLASSAAINNVGIAAAANAVKIILFLITNLIF